MKKLYRPLCFVAAVAAMSLTSCQKENFNPAGDGETVTITVHANVEDVANATKTHIEGTQVLWDENEEMKIILFGDSAKSITAFSSDSFVPDEGNATGTFTVKVKTTTHTKMAGIYPGTASGWIESETTAPIILPDKQNASAGSYDPNAYVMITASEDLQEGDFEWNARYKRIAALNKFTLTGLTEGIKKVIITFPEGQNAAGTRNFDLTTGKAGSMSEGSSNAITVNYSTPLSAGTNDIWFTSWGVQMNEGEILTIRAETADKAYTKEFPARKSGDLLLENYLNEGEFDMSGATEEPITPMPEFEAGEYWIMVNTGTEWKVAKPVSSSYGYLDVDDTTVGEDGTPVSTAANVFTIAAVDGGYTIQDASGKYYYMTGTFNNFNVSTEASQEGNVWSIEQTGENEYSIVNVLKNKTIQYASNYNSFGAYSDNRGILPNLVKAVYCDVTPSALTATAEAGTTTFNISSNEYWMIESNNSAYTVSPEEGTGDATITVTYPANESEDPAEVIFTVLSDSGIENTVTLTQTAKGQVVKPSEIFISEYIEGSSNNKYIEIYNPTDQDIDLSAYTVNCYANGATAPNNKHKLEGTLAAKTTLVLKHEKATLYQGDAVVSNAANFNGEKGDAISLSKNGENIDVWGYIGSNEDYGKDVTMRRNPDVIGPSATFIESQWTEYPKDDVSDLGKHTMNE